MTKIHELHQLGQSIWYDNINRGMLKSGEIQALIDKGVCGMTSNPTIFEKAITGGSDYDDDLRTLQAAGKSPMEIFEGLAIDDISTAADLLRPIYDESNGADGYISLEVSPELARDAQGTINAVHRYAKTLNRPNVMFKIPATPEGIPAVQHCISEGYSINITLMFSLDHYNAVTEAYISGLEKLAESGGDVSKVASVASFFISRVDAKVDAALQAKGNKALQGKIAIANAKLTYARFQEVFSGARWEKLASRGAQVQRPLWASTGTKNPDYSDTLYVDTLIGAYTVNTVPTETLQAVLDHARTDHATVTDHLEEAQQQIVELMELGINLDAITEELQEEGVEKFAQSFHSLLESIKEKQPV